MRAGQIDGDVKYSAAGALDRVVRHGAVAAQIDGTHVRTLGESISHGRASDSGQDAVHVLVVEAQHRQSVERQVVQEADEARLQSLKVAVVGCQVILVDIGNDRDQGCLLY